VDQLTDASERRAGIKMANEQQTSETTGTAADDRAWRAAQYVLGELSDSDAEAFEQVMLDDADLCELVLNATRLQAGIAVACRESSTDSVRPLVKLSVVESTPAFDAVRSQVSRIAVSLAGLGLAGILLTFATGSGEQSSGELAVVSAETADALANLISESETSELLALQDVDTDVDPVLSEVATPEWLLTAIELEDSSGQPQSSEESEVY
jgi:anti-sigma-K factor RskA